MGTYECNGLNYIGLEQKSFSMEANKSEFLVDLWYRRAWPLRIMNSDKSYMNV